MGTLMQVNILQTRCMGMGSTSLQTDIAMKVRGMMEGSRGWVSTRFEMVILMQAIGTWVP